MKPTTGLTPAMGRAIEAELAGASRDQAATAAGCSPRTIRRFHQDDLFLAELAKRRTKVLGNAATALTASAAGVVAVLVDVALGSRAANPVRVAAARATLEFALAFEAATATATKLDQLAAEVSKLREASKVAEWS